MENNFSVYQHVTPDGMYYFGQTQNVEKRWEYNGIHYKTTALQPYIEKYGWDNIKHIVLFRDQTRENALWIEDFLIETAREDGVCINKQRSGLVSKEEGYKQNQYQKNRDEILEQSRQYYQKNREKIKQYREQNKEHINERYRQYYEQNKEKIREQKKQYYEQNKDKRKDYLEQNKDKRLEYQRQYRKRKKLEKQLKEVVETTLF